MSSAIINLVAKKALGSAAKKNINSKDPYFEEVRVLDKHGRDTGHIKKQKKGVPIGVSAHDGAILMSVRRKAHRYDMGFSICGFKFGWSAIIGIIPGFGDVIDCLLAYLVVRKASSIEGGLPAMIHSKMIFNIMLDFGMGLVPLLGDVADTIFRANTRNAWILEEFLIKKAEAEGKVPGVSGDTQLQGGLAHPQPSKSFFGRGKTRGHDEEMAMDNLDNNGPRAEPSSQQQRSGR